MLAFRQILADVRASSASTTSGDSDLLAKPAHGVTLYRGDFLDVRHGHRRGIERAVARAGELETIVRGEIAPELTNERLRRFKM